MAGDVSVQAPKVVPKKPWKAFVFVILGFFFWFLFAWMARVVTTCSPNSDLLRCAFDLHQPAQLGWGDAAIMATTLGLAIWAGRRIVFPPDD